MERTCRYTFSLPPSLFPPSLPSLLPPLLPHSLTPLLPPPFAPSLPPYLLPHACLSFTPSSPLPPHTPVLYLPRRSQQYSSSAGGAHQRVKGQSSAAVSVPPQHPSGPAPLQDDVLVAYQIAFDLYESATQHFLRRVQDAIHASLPAPPPPPSTPSVVRAIEPRMDGGEVMVTAVQETGEGGGGRREGGGGR